MTCLNRRLSPTDHSPFNGIVQYFDYHGALQVTPKMFVAKFSEPVKDENDQPVCPRGMETL
jgi:hypothetical protein